MQPEIYGLKLVNGEEIVAKVTKITDTTMTIEDPLVMVLHQDPKGITCNFFPWTIIADGTLPINRDLVISHYPVPKDVQDSYIQNTTGIQIVGAPPMKLNG